jgi:hypothetical protein
MHPLCTANVLIFFATVASALADCLFSGRSLTPADSVAVLCTLVILSPILVPVSVANACLTDYRVPSGNLIKPSAFGRAIGSASAISLVLIATSLPAAADFALTLSGRPPRVMPAAGQHLGWCGFAPVSALLMLFQGVVFAAEAVALTDRSRLAFKVARRHAAPSAVRLHCPVIQ